MIGNWPKVIYKEEGMREGMQIEDANISVDDKVRLLDALSETGLKQIVVGSFVSPKWTPQMARIDEIVSRFTPRAGVTYTALALNERGVERAKQYSPPLSIERDKWPRLNCHMCDAFVVATPTGPRCRRWSGGRRSWPRPRSATSKRRG